MINTPFTYQFIGERLCLDFCNTGEDRERGYVGELMGSYEELLNWSQQAGLLTPDEVAALQRASMENPGAAKAVYQRAIVLREALYRLFSAVAGERDPSPDDMVVLNEQIGGVLGYRRVTQTAPNGAGFAWGWENILTLDRMVWPVVLSAADLLVSPDLVRVRECGNGNCSWLFLDLSRNHSRRWCNMDSCGNRVKARRFRRREKGSAG